MVLFKILKDNLEDLYVHWYDEIDGSWLYDLDWNENIGCNNLPMLLMIYILWKRTNGLQ